jgi:hypothetical protein
MPEKKRIHSCLYETVRAIGTDRIGGSFYSPGPCDIRSAPYCTILLAKDE